MSYHVKFYGDNSFHGELRRRVGELCRLSPRFGRKAPLGRWALDGTFGVGMSCLAFVDIAMAAMVSSNQFILEIVDLGRIRKDNQWVD